MLPPYLSAVTACLYLQNTESPVLRAPRPRSCGRQDPACCGSAEPPPRVEIVSQACFSQPRHSHTSPSAVLLLTHGLQPGLLKTLGKLGLFRAQIPVGYCNLKRGMTSISPPKMTTVVLEWFTEDILVFCSRSLASAEGVNSPRFAFCQVPDFSQAVPSVCLYLP